MSSKRIRVWVGVTLCVCALWGRAQSAGAVDAVLTDRFTANITETLLAVPDPWRGPDEVGTDAKALRESILERVREHAPRWLADARTELGAQASATALSWALTARFANELGVWELAQLGAPADAAWRAAASSPGWCGGMESSDSWVVMQARRRALVPAGQREAVRAAAALALARLGQARADVPQRPAALVVPEVLATVAAERDGVRVSRLPMPPAVAVSLLADGVPPERWNGVLRCGVRQWWLRDQLARGQRPAAEVQLAFHLAQIDELVLPWRKPLEPGEGYPRTAASMSITGAVLVESTHDASGHVLEARVVGRRISMPGMGGTRPVVFETELDEHALARARARVFTPRPGEPGKTARVEYVYKWD